MKLVVDQDQRYAKMRAHTATHLLHAELAKIFPNTKQAGSLVDDDYLRFDFAADRLLDQYEVDKINKVINQIIYFAYPVKVDETSYKEAIKLGAKAFFEDKYGDEVRVVQIVGNIETQDGKEAVKSIELCGGTHVENTKDIGCFMIVSQEAVASWVKRIVAITGPKVYERMQEVQWILDVVVSKLGIKTATQLEDKLDKVMKEHDEMAASLESLVSVLLTNILTNAPAKKDKDFDKIINIPLNINFKNVLTSAKTLFDKQNVLIYNDEGNFLLMTKTWSSAKAIATKLGLKWWGNEQMVQGRDEKVLELFK